MISCYDFEKNNKASDIFNDIAILEEIEKKVLELQNLVKESQKKARTNDVSDAMFDLDGVLHDEILNGDFGCLKAVVDEACGDRL